MCNSVFSSVDEVFRLIYILYICLKKCGAKSAVKMQKWGQKAPSKQQSDGKKRHHSDKREKSHGGGKCYQNGKVVAENATKTAK